MTYPSLLITLWSNLFCNQLLVHFLGKTTVHTSQTFRSMTSWSYNSISGYNKTFPVKLLNITLKINIYFTPASVWYIVIQVDNEPFLILFNKFKGNFLSFLNKILFYFIVFFCWNVLLRSKYHLQNLQLKLKPQNKSG